MKIFLTGATGFIGSHVARVLVTAGHEVHALVRPQADLWRIADLKTALRLVTGDLRDPTFTLPAVTFDAGVHLAWYVQPGAYAAALENMDMLRASLRLAAQLATAGCRRFVAAGTLFEYDSQVTTAVTEAGPTRPRHLYAASKLALYEALTQYCRLTNMQLAWPRLFYQYGPYEHAQRFVPFLINSLLRNQVAKLTSGDQVCDYLHVADTATALCAIIESNLTGIVNLASGSGHTVKEIATRLGVLLGKPQLIALNALPYPPDTPMYMVADITRLRIATHWRPQFSLDSGLLNTVNWWRNRCDHIR